MPVKFSNFSQGPTPIPYGATLVGLLNGINTQYLWTGASDAIQITVTQTAHGFFANQVVRMDGDQYVLAQADSVENSNSVGIVSEVLDANSFTVLMYGFIDLGVSVIPGDLYYLDPLVPGALTTTKPVSASDVVKVMFIGATITGGYFLNYPSGGGGSGSGFSLTISVDQAAHGFSFGDVLRLNGITYQLAQADNSANAEAIGIVSEVTGADTFNMIITGLLGGFTGLTAGVNYYLSPSTPGALTPVETTDAGDIEKPMMISISATAGIVLNFRGRIIPDVQAATNLALIDNNLVSVNMNGDVNIVPNGTGFTTIASVLKLLNDKELRWYNSANTFYSAFKALSGLSSSTTWVLPPADGISGYSLITDGSGNLSFEPGSSDTVEITQAAHGFSAGQPLRLSGTSYVLAQADTAQHAEVVGMVSEIVTTDIFLMTLCGVVEGLSALIPGDVYYLDAVTPGVITNTSPVTPGLIQKPIFWPYSTTAGYFINQRGKIIPDLPVSTFLEFDNNNIISTNTDGDINLVPNGAGIVTVASELDILAGKSLRWYNASGSNYVGFNAQSGLATNLDFQLPTADGSSGYVLKTNGSGVLSFAAENNSSTWNIVSGTSQTLAVSNQYVSTNASLTTFTLPASCAAGSWFEVTGIGAAGWTISQNSGQSIKFDLLGALTSTTTGVGGSISGGPGTSAKIICTTANTTFLVITPTGTIAYV